MMNIPMDIVMNIRRDATDLMQEVSYRKEVKKCKDRCLQFIIDTNNRYFRFVNSDIPLSQKYTLLQMVERNYYTWSREQINAILMDGFVY